MVLTSNMCNIQGSGRDSLDGSSGGVVLIRASSSTPSFQTMSLLSLPCLQGLGISE